MIHETCLHSWLWCSIWTFLMVLVAALSLTTGQKPNGRESCKDSLTSNFPTSLEPNSTTTESILLRRHQPSSRRETGGNHWVCATNILTSGTTSGSRLCEHFSLPMTTTQTAYFIGFHIKFFFDKAWVLGVLGACEKLLNLGIICGNAQELCWQPLLDKKNDGLKLSFFSSSKHHVMVEGYSNMEALADQMLSIVTVSWFNIQRRSEKICNVTAWPYNACLKRDGRWGDGSGPQSRPLLERH